MPVEWGYLTHKQEFNALCLKCWHRVNTMCVLLLALIFFCYYYLFMLLLFQGLLNHLASHEVRGHYKTSPSRFLTLLLLFVHSSLCIGLFHFIIYMVHHGCLKMETQSPSPHPLLGQNPTVPHNHAQLCQGPATLTPESL